MADARVTIEGRIAADPRFNSTPNGNSVVNLRVLAGRSKKLEDGSWETLSQTAYDVSLWNEHAALADAFQPAKGDSVTVTGTIAGVESYDGKNGVSLSVKVNGDGLRVFKKQSQPAQQSGQSWGPSQQSQPAQGSWGSSPGWGEESQSDAPPF